ncbi:class I SAM-dependent methyltransferase [Nocardia sp. NPDC059240]|uniref:class I SAM-dependent methyltransferase n=1 Tax=Nocardia sp. NPDC059240 TaxID=3346786 RepID=UPI00368D7B90
MTDAGPITPAVSDTARWVAAYRAEESARPDALFHDPLAALLTGEVGHTIAAETRDFMGNGWPIIVRTKLIDERILAAITNGCDLVINLAAGLDTRPYRLDLPGDLRWIEADLPALVAEKTHLLEAHTPRCHLTRHAVDLADTTARRAFLSEALTGASRAFVLTEGLVMYLHPADVTQLALDLHREEITDWVVDISSIAIAKALSRTGSEVLRNAPFHFTPTNGVAFFEGLGWTARDIEPVLQAARRFRRLPPLLRLYSRLPAPNPRLPGTRIPYSAVLHLTAEPEYSPSVQKNSSSRR